MTQSFDPISSGSEFDARPEVAVIGGGVIALACARELARRGVRVSLFERGEIGAESSAAAGGMLAVACEEWVHPWPVDGRARSSMVALCRRSRDSYAALSEELLEESGHDIELSLAGAPRGDWREPGILFVDDPPAPKNLGPGGFDADGFDAARPPFERHSLGARRDRTNDTGPEAPALGGAARRALVERAGGLEREWNGARAVWLASDGQVESRQLARALRGGARAHGARIHEHAPVERLEIGGPHEGIVALHTPLGRVCPERVLLCAGAWSGLCPDLAPQARPPIEPLAGQMVQLRGEERLRHVVYARDCYLIPRRDGRLLVGATVEPIGFVKRNTAAGLAHLLSRACALAPVLADAAFEGCWAGLRPASPDGLPILGGGPCPNLFYATGHGRNGVLLAPATAQLLAGALCEKKPIPPEFAIERFATTPNAVF